MPPPLLLQDETRKKKRTRAFSLSDEQNGVKEKSFPHPHPAASISSSLLFLSPEGKMRRRYHYIAIPRFQERFSRQPPDRVRRNINSKVLFRCTQGATLLVFRTWRNHFPFPSPSHESVAAPLSPFAPPPSFPNRNVKGPPPFLP